MNAFPSFSSFSAVENTESLKRPSERENNTVGEKDEYDTLKRKQKKKKRKHSDHKPDQPESFVIDKRPDDYNVEFQSVHNWQVPLYTRFGTRILGLSDNYRIQYQKRGKKPILFVTKFGSSDQKRSYAEFRRALREPTVNFKAAMKDFKHETDLDLNFIRLIDFKEEISVEKIQENPEFLIKNAEFSKAIETSPNDANLWISYIKHQNSLIEPNSKPALKRLVGDKQLQIYKKALVQLPNNIELLLGYLKLFSLVNEAVDSLNEWTRVLDKNQDYQLWNAFIEFRLGLYSFFSVTEMIQVFSQAIQSVTDKFQATNLLLKYLVFISQSGYYEKAICLVQAIVEFNCFLPEAFKNQSFDQKMIMFEQFWDTECARFGEKGALGWNNSILTAPEYVSVIDTMDERIELNTSDPLEKWMKAEVLFERKQWYPLRTDETDESIVEIDLFRNVLFDDIKDFIKEIGSENAMNLAFAFATGNFDQFDAGIFAQEAVMGSFDALITKNSSCESIKTVLRVREVTRNGSNVVFGTFLDQISKFQNSNELFLYRIHCADSDKKSKKIAKEHLKNDTQNVKLWLLYSEFEESIGNSQDAFKIYQSLLVYSRDPRLYKKAADLLFWKNNLENNAMHLFACFTSDALFEISLQDKGPLKPTILLSLTGKFKQILRETDSIDVLGMYALFEYIKSKNIDHVIQAVFEPLLKVECNEKIVKEMVLLYSRHSETNQYKPASLRQLLEKYINIFPNNLELWKLMAKNEQKLKIENYLRRFIDGKLASDCNLWIWACLNEFNTNQSRNYALSLLEKAVNTDSVQRSPVIWALYIKIQLLENSQKAKNLLFRAIRECPWCKFLYMLPFTDQKLSMEFDRDELVDLINLLQEKDIRLRCSLETIDLI